MLFRTYKPGPPLSDFVEALWSFEGYDAPHLRERVLPQGSMDLVINLRDDRLRTYESNSPYTARTFRGCLVSGARSEFVIIEKPSTLMAGVSFKPGGAFPFFNLPVGELYNQQVSLDDLWGSAANDLRDQLLEVQTPEARFLILERTLIARAIRPLAPNQAVAFALRQFENLSPMRTIGGVTGELGLSPRRFIQVFNDAVGLTPKLFCRIRRFQGVLRSISTGKSIDWPALAVDCGYFDQAHFIHDFKAFSGLSPTTYAANRTEQQNHVPLI
ncbi:MAG TPA: helix-turn-helix domain-containing protein [Blastocatellia bacterium]|nr:helix-turn-helix domain-containing protein [Blastocatellia bacterium]